jgi:UDP-N-acetylmuramoyl-L-alanyl-D-glutamate--2,6-diaminopimelate ligase
MKTQFDTISHTTSSLAAIIGGTVIRESASSHRGLITDSRIAEPGNIFLALRGENADGHNFIGKAIEAGASVIVCEDLPADINPEVTYIKVENSESVVGHIATAFYGNPTLRMQLVGVTGTNGKTTIATVLYNMFRKMGYKAGLISTVVNYIDGEAIPTEHTTPDPITLNELLGRMADAGCEYAFMEVSSHSVVQNRIGGLKFAGGIFTNITRDHLDYHKTFENYLKAKKQFFDNLPEDAFAITNADDKNGMIMVQNTKARIKTYSVRSMADFRAKIIECHFEGMYLDIDGREVGVQFIGKFNVSNLLAVYGAACMLSKDPHEVLVAMSAMTPVSGRFEALRSPEGYTAIVDYAHTPDGLEKAINAVRSFTKGRVITLFGCGGDRDKTKRPKMGRMATELSDIVVVTTDNPRTEQPEEIIKEILIGTVGSKAEVITITDRSEAIEKALKIAKQGDTILLAGKGHETYQVIGTERVHYDEREIIKSALNR